MTKAWPEAGAAGENIAAASRPPVSSWFERRESIVFIAALMGLLSLSIEVALPALARISAVFQLADPNSVQSVVSVFLIAYGAGHLFQGFLADRFGRKPVLVANLLVYSAASAICMATSSFEIFLAARALQGVAAGGCRVVGTAVLRDVKDGAELARAMALAMMIFSAIPVVAPIAGQAILLFAGYRAVFALLSVIPLILLVIALVRLPETWGPERRLPIRLSEARRSVARLFSDRDTLAYSAIAGILYGVMFTFVASSPQIYIGMFGVQLLFAGFVSAAAFSVGAGALLSARIVRLQGPRRVALLGLCTVFAASVAMFAAFEAGALGIALFQGAMMVLMFGNGVAFANCNMLAIQPHREISGVASALVGGAVMIISAMLSHAIGQSFDGTLRHMALSFPLLSALALAIERFNSWRARKTMRPLQ